MASGVSWCKTKPTGTLPICYLAYCPPSLSNWFYHVLSTWVGVTAIPTSVLPLRRPETLLTTFEQDPILPLQPLEATAMNINPMDCDIVNQPLDTKCTTLQKFYANAG
jgi:hypothetical protein